MFAWEKKNRKGKRGKYLEKETFFLRRRIKAEKKRDECIWLKKRFLTGVNKSGEEKEGK